MERGERQRCPIGPAPLPAATVPPGSTRRPGRSRRTPARAPASLAPSWARRSDELARDGGEIVPAEASDDPEHEGAGGEGCAHDADAVPARRTVEGGGKYRTGGSPGEVQEHVRRGETASGLGTEAIDLSLIGDVQSVCPNVQGDDS